MESQGNGRCSGRFLLVLLTSALLLQALGLDNLLCRYCPLQYKGISCSNLTSRCLAHQRCSSSRGFYGSVHVLSAQGCLDVQLCGTHQTVSHRLVRYNVSHACCCRDLCNEPPRAESLLKKLLDWTVKSTGHVNHTGLLLEEPLDSCANYTAPSSAAEVELQS